MATTPVVLADGEVPAIGTKGGAEAPSPAADSIVALWPGRHWVLYLAVSLLLGAYLGLNSYISVRSVHSIAPWMPFIWEISSVLVICLLMPLIVRFEDRFRIDTHVRVAVIFAHLAAIFVFSALHVAGMAFWNLGYQLAPTSYEVNPSTPDTFATVVTNAP